MIISGKKAGKAKASRFLEAGRLLSHIRLFSSDENENGFLRLRTSWLWSQLHECQGEMQQAFLAAEQTLAIVESLIVSSSGLVPDCSGPDLSGYSFAELTNVLSRRISSLKMAKDLEKAREELSRMGTGDTEAAKRTVSILSSSVHDAVRHLGLDGWRGDDLRTEFSCPSELEAWERRLDAETELEPRLAVFGEACTKSSDLVGELVCFSVRLRMGVHYYAAKLRSEKDGDHNSGGKGPDSSSGRLSDLLVQIRRFVALLKKLSSPACWTLWNSEVGVSGWSMEEAARISALALVSLTSLTISKIPSLRYAASNTDLSGSQKNVRLGFTRCMLAFARSLFIIQRCMPSNPLRTEVFSAYSHSSDGPETRTMLYVLHLCLKSLVARGCCREEGTSGALIKLYAKFLCLRVQQMAVQNQETALAKLQGGHGRDQLSVSANAGKENLVGEAALSSVSKGISKDGSQSSSQESADDSRDEVSDLKDDPDYEWKIGSLLRHELAQCYQCLYHIPELQSPSIPSTTLNSKRWLEDGCRVSKHIGLSFTTGDPTTTGTTMDVDVCKNVFLFYRKLIFEGVCRRRRDGGRAKRLREVLYRLAESLPADAPHTVPMVPFRALNKIVGDVVETSTDISREAAENVSKLEDEWNQCKSKFYGPESLEEKTRRLQMSIVFFEVFALHAMSIFSAYDAEYKKHKTAERRKRPREVADRLFQASSECIIALRIRPWSVGAWILLGRIYVEIADLALDERELSLSSFGLCRAEDLQTLGEGDTIETLYFGSAEACFGFADSLLRHPWAQNAASERLDSCVAEVLGYAFEEDEDEPWCGFGDDGDIFGSFGLTNTTTSRPVLMYEDHPAKVEKKKDVCRLSAVRFGEAAVGFLRLQERRFYHIHWTKSTIGTLFPTHPQNRYSGEILAMASTALQKLREGLGWGGFRRDEWPEYDLSNTNAISEGDDATESCDSIAEWREGYTGVKRLKWYFSLLEAKLMEKSGDPPEKYIPMFHRALEENRTLRERLKQPVDIEPLYKLHATRMKILRVTEDDVSASGFLMLLEKYSFKPGPVSTAMEVEKWCDNNVEDWIAERKNAIAEDILSAMQYCRDVKSGVPYSEYHFKSTYCRALVLSEVLKDTSGAVLELNKFFRMDAATKVLDQGRGAAHRGYFYKMWNYRITDTGVEPTLEPERKWVRWRGKILGLYSHLLQQGGEWRMLAAIISRLKRRTSEDLPVDGAVLDDLIRAYALTSRTAILNSMDKGIVTSVSVFEGSFFRTWDIYVESLRLAQGIKRVQACLRRGDRNETGAERLVGSGRPWCLMAIHTALRLEHLRWKSAVDGGGVDREAAHALPVDGGMGDLDVPTRRWFVETLEVSAGKWALDEKMMKLLQRRIREYSAPPTAGGGRDFVPMRA
ncbi:unnamed protein product [Chondrus crispus]|uniref:Uncharacterized protein n=1 Tax=Chondrus crispus TaxID=2769 RepID=R7QH03_CHOCR|nr:unnamed protein product [Chondrus crispus]CDF37807.1 unnamed protein product [Chondrus crispus]|eukprot:XP_005717678.1 unnamed protein product [Chondrus crispus]